uniref:3-oxo-5-alpha-steroid 4-dehydrogenase 1 n=1 Tax=Pinguiococcus pyrenoidosus TaxID=172671 RepID=A0A7R9YDD7_9STRA|mmetsp:Transcript_2276/g.9800  ORF Transcript_2276/g.9800 Transcript_2276/m.9800 type:complete len:254 (+) Transcript_2276:166-927(+)
MQEQTFIFGLSVLMLGTGVVAFLSLTVLRAPYGRYSSKQWGPRIPARLAWFVMESPTLVWTLLCLQIREDAGLAWANWLLLAMFSGHYVNRAIAYPLLLRGGKAMPVLVCALAWTFCVVNGYLQARSICSFDEYAEGWTRDPRFLLGSALWAAGLLINVQSDGILRNLRKPGETGYKIPRGGMFEYISGAHYFGEILEWIGFAMASWRLRAAAFAFFTACNIGPRAYHHHLWYKEKFPETCPKRRRALIPFVV